MEETKEWCGVAWLRPRCDGATKGDRKCEGGFVMKGNAVGGVLDGSSDADYEVVEGSRCMVSIPSATEGGWVVSDCFRKCREV